MNIAIITGASSGLGREYARLLASEETLDELWLIARRRDLLESLAQELSPVPCRIFSCDLTQETVFPALQQQLAQSAGLEVRWLINAAGFGRIGISSDINLTFCSHLFLLIFFCHGYDVFVIIAYSQEPQVPWSRLWI